MPATDRCPSAGAPGSLTSASAVPPPPRVEPCCPARAPPATQVLGRACTPSHRKQRLSKRSSVLDSSLASRREPSEPPPWVGARGRGRGEPGAGAAQSGRRGGAGPGCHAGPRGRRRLADLRAEPATLAPREGRRASGTPRRGGKRPVVSGARRGGGIRRLGRLCRAGSLPAPSRPRARWQRTPGAWSQVGRTNAVTLTCLPVVNPRSLCSHPVG